MSALSERLCVGGLAALMLIAYGRVWTFGFLYDDPWWVDQAGGLWAVATWLGGGLPWAFHGLALGLHLVNGGLLWALARRWLSPIAALLVLLLLWLHPLQVASVAYVTGAIEAQLTLYVLLAIWGCVTGRWWSVVLGLVSLGLAVSLKWSALSLLLVLPLFVGLVPRWVRVAGGGALVIVVGAVIGRAWPSMAGWLAAEGDRLEPMRLLALAIWRYLAFVVWPWGFSIEHDWRAAPIALGWLAVAGLLTLGIVAWRSRVTWLAWIAVVGLVLPRALVPDAPPLTEHHTRLPFLAVWLMAGAAFDSLHERLTHG